MVSLKSEIELNPTQILYSNGNGFSKKITLIKKKSKKNIKNSIILSFPGYPRKEELTISKTHLAKFPGLESNNESLSEQSFNKNIKITRTKQTFGKKGLYDHSFYFKKFKFEKSFLFSKIIKSKDFKLIHIEKKISNPYAIYRFENFMEKNFENYLIKRDKTFYLLNVKNLFITILNNLKKFTTMLGLLFEKNPQTLGFLIFFGLFFHRNSIFSIFLFSWNFVFYKIFLIISRKIARKIARKKNISEKKNSFAQEKSSILKSVYEVGVFFNGALRTLNMLAT
jgi:hypothetical protein